MWLCCGERCQETDDKLAHHFFLSQLRTEAFSQGGHEPVSMLQNPACVREEGWRGFVSTRLTRGVRLPLSLQRVTLACVSEGDRWDPCGSAASRGALFSQPWGDAAGSGVLCGAGEEGSWKPEVLKAAQCWGRQRRPLLWTDSSCDVRIQPHPGTFPRGDAGRVERVLRFKEKAVVLTERFPLVKVIREVCGGVSELGPPRALIGGAGWAFESSEG